MRALLFRSGGDGPSHLRQEPRFRPVGAIIVSLLGLAATIAFTTRSEGPGIPAPAARSATVAAPARVDGAELLFDPRPALGARTANGWRGKPLAAALLPTDSGKPAKLATVAPNAPTAEMSPASAPAPGGNLAAFAPVPVPRPADVATAVSPRAAERRMSRRARIAASPVRIEDNRNFFEKLFGLEPAPKPALAYASLDTGPLPAAPKPRLSPVPEPQASAGTAIYDISAQTVYMPNGEKLEAHSGLRDKLDDPRFVHMRMVGATPPGTYDLSEREALFHGVRAIRLNPVGGAAAIFGRAGILAHTYMLGPKGDSNGCVSFRDYNRFLQAFLNGEVKRLVVVSGRGYDAVPGGRSLFGMTARPERGA